MTASEAGAKLSGRVLMPTRRFPEAITPEELLAMAIPPGTVVRGACFACEMEESMPFPPEMTGVRFCGCNLDNVRLPDGNTVEG